MKATKIEIKKKIVDIEDMRPYREIARDPMSATSLVDDDPTMVTMTEDVTTYYPRKIINPKKGEEMWLVRQDDNTILDGLFDIYRTDWERVLQERESLAEEHGHWRGYKEGKDAMKKTLCNQSVLQRLSFLLCGEVRNN